MEERREEVRSSKACCWNLTIFQDPELSEGRGSILWAIPGSVIETEWLILQPGASDRCNCSPHIKPSPPPALVNEFI